MNKEIFPPELFQRHGDIGVEEEFYVVDQENYQPIEKPRKFINNPPKELKNNLGVELFDFIIEIWIDKVKSLEEAFEEVKEKREILKKHAKDHGYKIIGAGLHPCLNWKIYENTDKPNYLDQIERIQYPQKRNITAGLHIHIGMDDEEKAIWLANEVRRYLPLFLALSSNSPYWQGRDTGLQSTRALIFENLPNTGTPSYFEDMDQYRQTIKTLIDNDFIKGPGEIWWDVRINPKYGTLEIRVPDAQNKIKRTRKLIKLVYEVIKKLKKEYEQGKPNSVIKYELLVQNKWQAMRYGIEADFVFPEKKYGAKELLLNLIKETDLEKKEFEKLLEEIGSDEQREIKEKKGIRAVLKSLEIDY